MIVGIIENKEYLLSVNKSSVIHLMLLNKAVRVWMKCFMVSHEDVAIILQNSFLPVVF